MEGTGTHGVGKIAQQSAKQIPFASSTATGLLRKSVEAQVRGNADWPFAASEVTESTRHQTLHFSCESGIELATSDSARTKQVQEPNVCPSQNARSVVQEVHEHNQELAQESVREISVGDLFTLLDQQGGKCAISGRLLTVDNVTLDHIAAFSESNDHTIENVQLVTAEVNRAKGCMGMSEFIELCHDVAKTDIERRAREFVKDNVERSF